MSSIKGGNMQKAHLIGISEFGNAQIGQLNVASLQDGIPFDVKRVFWTHHTPIDISRGRHAHYETEMVLFCIVGKIKVKTIHLNGEELTFTLDSADQKGLYIPKLVWHEMWYGSVETIQIVVASTYFQESDYIRDFEVFSRLGKSDG